MIVVDLGWWKIRSKDPDRSPFYASATVELPGWWSVIRNYRRQRDSVRAGMRAAGHEWIGWREDGSGHAWQWWQRLRFRKTTMADQQTCPKD